jgi:nitroreductase
MSDTIELSPDELLTTTRAVRRRMDFDRPVPLEVIKDCVRIALQAPSGSNRQGWHWIVITDPDQRARLADLYRGAFGEYRDSATHSGGLFAADGRHSSTQKRIAGSVEYLAQNLHRVPVLLLACITSPSSAVLPDATQASMWGSLFSRGVGLHACRPSPRARHSVDRSAPAPREAGG